MQNHTCKPNFSRKKNKKHEVTLQSGTYPTVPQLNLEKKQEQLEMFQKSQRREMENVIDFKSNLLIAPNSIKKIMKTEKDVRMIADESPVLLAKACELLIQELNLRYLF